MIDRHKMQVKKWKGTYLVWASMLWYEDRRTAYVMALALDDQLVGRLRCCIMYVPQQIVHGSVKAVGTQNKSRGEGMANLPALISLEHRMAVVPVNDGQ